MDIDHRSRNNPWVRRAGVPVNGIALVACVALYCLNRFILKEAVGGWFLRCYFNDILAGVVILAYTNLFFIAVGKAEHSFRSLATILPYALLAGLFWEFIAPMFITTSVTDAWDIMAYCAGGSAYWLIQRITKGEQSAAGDGLSPAPEP